MTTASPISQVFASLRSQKQMAFMPFITAGDPDMETTVAAVRELAARGVDLIEMGFPYSDPIADGPVIQASYTRALDAGLKTDQIFTAIGALTREADTEVALPPLVAMVAFAIVCRRGVASFAKAAREAGFAGLIIPDLPGDEAADVARIVTEQGCDLIQLIAPTTPSERVERILQSASGFVYCISVSGTTGVRAELPPELLEQLKALRKSTELPLAVGFGIGKPEQVESLRGLADGVIVGSAIVKKLERLSDQSATRDDALRDMGEFAAALVAAARS